MLRRDGTQTPDVIDDRMQARLPVADDEPETDLDEAESELDGDDADDLEDGEDTALDGTAAAAVEEPEGDYASGPDDALGLYLRQMGSIPLLNRQKELDLAQRLEYHRNRFRSATLLCARIMNRVAEKFEQIRGAQAPLDPHIDVYSTAELRLSRIQILARLESDLPTMRQLLQQEAREFAAGLRDEFPGSRQTWRRVRFRRMAKCARLAKELSPRTELLERWADELSDLADEVKHLVRAREQSTRPSGPSAKRPCGRSSKR